MVRVALLMLAATAPASDIVPAGMANIDVARRAEEEFRCGVDLRGDHDKAVPHFRTAADYFEELRRRGADNPELYRNLGNAALLADDLPRAILAYHRGLRLAPADGELQAGLEEARKRVVYATDTGFGRPADDRGPPWLPRLGSEWFLAGAAVCYAAACFLATRWLMTRARRWLAGGAVALAAAAGLTVLVVQAVRSEREERERPLAVLSEDGVLLRKGDGLTYPARYETPLNKGAEARRLSERNGWVQVELSGGEVGWVRRDCVLIDAP
jgi:tetratricopeptide (TPR) repeat protein